MNCDDEEEIDEVEFAKQVIEYLKKERAALLAAGLDVDPMIRQLEEVLEEVNDAKGRVDDLQRQILKSTGSPVAWLPGPYMAPVEHLDMAAADLRSDNDVMEYFRRLRRRFTQFDDEGKGFVSPNGEN